MRTTKLLAELRAAREMLTGKYRSELAEAGIPRPIIDQYPLIGRTLAHVRRRLYMPDPDGLPVYVTPVLVASPISPETPHPLAYARHLGECVDLVAWHPARPESWALRTGAAEWLGCIEPQYMAPEPVRVHRCVLSWLQDSCQGIVPLGRTPSEVRNVLTYCASITAEDRAHAIDLRRALRAPWFAPTISVVTPRGS